MSSSALVTELLEYEEKRPPGWYDPAQLEERQEFPIRCPKQCDTAINNAVTNIKEWLRLLAEYKGCRKEDEYYQDTKRELKASLRLETGRSYSNAQLKDWIDQERKRREREAEAEAEAENPPQELKKSKQRSKRATSDDDEYVPAPKHKKSRTSSKSPSGEEAPNAKKRAPRSRRPRMFSADSSSDSDSGDEKHPMAEINYLR